MIEATQIEARQSKPLVFFYTAVNTSRESFPDLEIEYEKGPQIAPFRKCAIFFFR